MSRTVSLPLGPEHVGRRIDGVAAELAARLPEPLSRTRIKALIEEHRAELDGSVVVNPSLKLPSATVLVLHLPPPADATPGPEALPLDVVY
ncbi:MAG: RNA pseudouridine synthase, partial [Parafilimonas terrae]|nr:RNA pseudouridine synthase [Parafilimonas terrae]